MKKSQLLYEGNYLKVWFVFCRLSEKYKEKIFKKILKNNRFYYINCNYLFSNTIYSIIFQEFKNFGIKKYYIKKWHLILIFVNFKEFCVVQIDFFDGKLVYLLQ